MNSETPKPGTLLRIDEVMPKRVAQTLVEIDFALSLLPCSECGAYERDDAKYGSWGDPNTDTAQNSLYTSYCTCPGCEELRRLVSWTVNDPRQDVAGFGPLPSQLIEPWQFMHEADRLLAIISSKPSELTWREVKSHYADLFRATQCSGELRKFVVEGSETLAEGEYTEAGHAHRAAHIERYQSSSVIALHEHLAALKALYLEEKTRIHAEQLAECGLPKVPVGNLDRDSISAHQSWLLTKSGEGRLHLENQAVQNQRLHGSQFSSSQWLNIDLIGNSLSSARFDGGDLKNVRVTTSTLESTHFPRAKLTSCTFTDSLLNLLDVVGASIEECEFSNCELFYSNFTSAKVVRSNFKKCDFHDSTLNQSHFVACSFAGNYMGATPKCPDLATTVNARFEDCDFRGTGWRGRDLSGATFIRCKFAGSRGVPRAHSGLSLRDCDVTLAEFLTMLAIVDPPPTQAVAVPTYPALPPWLNAALVERIGPESPSNPTLRLLDRTLIARTPSGHRFVATLEKVTADPAAPAHFALITLTIQETPSGITLYDVERRREMPAAGRLNTTIAVALT
jgi:uncharacterized protein YjbI with pentapeptide repeats